MYFDPENLELEKIMDNNSEPILVYEQDYFSLTLPAAFLEDGPGRIKPKEDDLFPDLRFGVYDAEDNLILDRLFEMEKEGYSNLGTETESFPQIIDHSEIEIDNVPGIFIITENGRSMGNSTEKQFGYRYIFLNDEIVINFTIYEYGQERTQEFEDQVNQIMSTIKFK